MNKYLHLFGWIAVVAIALLSLLPGDVRPYVVGSHYVHHVLAYMIAAIFLALGYDVRTHFFRIVVLLMLFAGTLEITQLWIPGRNSSLADFTASSFGIWFGALGSFLLLNVSHRREQASSKLD